MNNGKNHNKLKISLILVFISLCFPDALIYMFFRDIPFLTSFFYDYFTSNYSIFIPSLPYINILWFLPYKYQITKFSIGHLIDIVIIINLSFSIQASFYHYIQRVCLNEETQIFVYYIDSYSLGSKEKLNMLSQDPDSILGLKYELTYYPDDKLLDVILKRNHRFNGGIDSFYDQLRRKRYRSNIQNRIFHRKPEFTFINRYKNLRVYCYHSVFEKFWIFHSKNHYHYPKINNYTIFNEYFQLEG